MKSPILAQKILYIKISSLIPHYLQTSNKIKISLKRSAYPCNKLNTNSMKTAKLIASSVFGFGVFSMAPLGTPYHEAIKP